MHEKLDGFTDQLEKYISLHKEPTINRDQNFL